MKMIRITLGFVFLGSLLLVPDGLTTAWCFCSPVFRGDNPGHFMILSEFAEVDGELTAADEAERNNQRDETERWAAQLRSMVEGEPEWIHFDELYRTGITGNLRTG